MRIAIESVCVITSDIFWQGADVFALSGSGGLNLARNLTLDRWENSAFNFNNIQLFFN